MTSAARTSTPVSVKCYTLQIIWRACEPLWHTMPATIDPEGLQYYQCFLVPLDVSAKQGLTIGVVKTWQVWNIELPFGEHRLNQAVPDRDERPILAQMDIDPQHIDHAVDDGMVAQFIDIDADRDLKIPQSDKAGSFGVE